MKDLAEIQEREARRRLKLLGKTIEDTAGSLVGIRARQVGLPTCVLRHWHECYRRRGLDGLLPTDWPELPDAIWELIEQRYQALGEIAEAEVITLEDFHTLAVKQGWTLQQVRRWLQRYRVHGPVGLAPVSRPTRPRAFPDLGTLSAEQRNELFRRRALLGELAEQAHVSNEILRKRAETVEVSLRALRDYHTRFQRVGLAGLAPRSRGDKGNHHGLSSQIVQIVEHLRLTHRDAPVRFVYELACQHAATIEENAPSLWQVRSICRKIPAPVRLLADGREAEFRNRYRLTYPIAHDPERIVWQIDHKAPLHVLVRDLRTPSHRSLSGEIRPFLTLVVDSASRLIMAGLFSYDRPDRFTVAAAIRTGMLMGENKPYGGVPDEIWVDNGKELVAQHVHQLALGLGIMLVPGPPHEPQVRGIVERLHETLDTRLWATLPGYVGANAAERNPQAKAELTLAQLDQRFRAFIERYHHEIHSETGQTPLAFWQVHAAPFPVDERLLDVLLKEPAQRRVLKEGIKYAGQVYWHTELAVLVGEDVLVRAAPCYTAPDELEVFFEGQWRCTAFALTSAKGQRVQRKEIAQAQRRQRAHARRRIEEAREAIETSSSPPPEKRQRSNKVASLPEVPVAPPFSSRAPDLFDFLVEQQTNQKGRAQ